MKAAKTLCFYLVVAFGIRAIAYAIKGLFIENTGYISLLYLGCAAIAAGLLKKRRNYIRHIDLSVVLIAFFTASVINGNLIKTGWLVTIICMLYLLGEVLQRFRGKDGNKKTPLN
ncbi:hypothetical protein [Alteromonas lipolytica]|uniref:Uncharacterized protein n=1 Tax=Alteromonas lipolytica TaxID=1856405 RepID=A0A1E8FJ07_9ALTE|nr:hypothetical protein [Alteromonas lipolytica]OFI35433.1 hypothetical protein BFC17_11735 [Alteromonas lipolytica]GGF76220.1 hypothetical protein GCM10011338_30480 [Alteromonas lipolytica]